MRTICQSVRKWIACHLWIVSSCCSESGMSRYSAMRTHACVYAADGVPELGTPGILSRMWVRKSSVPVSRTK